MNIFTKLNVTTNDPYLHTIKGKDISFFNERLEQNSYEHWVFDTEEDGLVGRVNGRTLTVQNKPPVYQENHVQVLVSAGNALLTDAVDRANQTICFVCKPQYGYQLALAGTNIPNASGSFVMASNGLLFANQGGPTASTQLTDPMDTDRWLFIALSEGPDRTFFVGNAFQFQDSPPPKTINENTMAIGNAYRAGTSTGRHSYGEFIYYDRSLPLEEIQEVYERSKVRMANRGIDVL